MYEARIEALDVAESRKVFVERPDESHSELKQFKAVWNLSKNTCGCIASTGYKIVQHRELVRSLIEAIENLNIRHEVSLNSQGHRLFVDVKFPEVKLLAKEVDEEFIGGLRIINSYDKTTGLIIVPRLERLACSNGMVVAKFIGGFSVRHNAPLVEEFAGLIEKTLNDMINSCPKLQAIVNDCISDSIEWELCKRLVKALIKREKHTELILENIDPSKTITRWDIYNAITRYATHGEQLKPNVEHWLQNKAQRLLHKPLEQFPLAEVE
jgi:hypothetical protein